MKNNIIITILTTIIIIVVILLTLYMIKNEENYQISHKNVEVKNEVRYENTYTNNTVIQKTNTIIDEFSQENEEFNNDIFQENDTSSIQKAEQEIEIEYIAGYEVAGHMKIPKFNLDIPVFKYLNIHVLDISVGIAIRNLNEIGNTIIMGHAYE